MRMRKYSEFIGIKMTPFDRKNLEVAATGRGLTISDAVRIAIDQFVDAYGEECLEVIRKHIPAMISASSDAESWMPKTGMKFIAIDSDEVTEQTRETANSFEDWH